MHDALLMGGVYGTRQRLDQPRGLLRRLRLALQLIGQAAAGDQLQREVRLPLMLTHLEDLHDVRVLQASDRLRFRTEARFRLGPDRAPIADHLESDDAIKARLARLV